MCPAYAPDAERRHFTRPGMAALIYITRARVIWRTCLPPKFTTIHEIYRGKGHGGQGLLGSDQE